MSVDISGATNLTCRLESPPARACGQAVVVRRRLAAIQPYLYLLPAFLGIGFWIYWPIVGTFELSFYQWNLLPTTPRVPVGIANYVNVLTLPEMGRAILNTFVYILGLLPFSVILPLAIVLLVHDITGRMRLIYRAIIFVPVLMAPVVVAVIWRWMLNPTQGILTLALESAFGFAPTNWFRHPDLAIWAIIFITGWKLIGFSVLIFSAGLTNVGTDYISAVQVDGATRWQVIRHVTLPLLSPTIMFMILLTILLSAQWTFPLVNVLTGGGPLDSTTSVYFLLWEFGFRNFNVGFSSAAAVLFFIGFGLLAFVCTKLIDRFSFYDN